MSKGRIELTEGRVGLKARQIAMSKEGEARIAEKQTLPNTQQLTNGKSRAIDGELTFAAMGRRIPVEIKWEEREKYKGRSLIDVEKGLYSKAGKTRLDTRNIAGVATGQPVSSVTFHDISYEVSQRNCFKRLPNKFILRSVRLVCALRTFDYRLLC